jgi:hypothetical protein
MVESISAITPPSLDLISVLFSLESNEFQKDKDYLLRSTASKHAKNPLVYLFDAADCLSFWLFWWRGY